MHVEKRQEAWEQKGVLLKRGRTNQRSSNHAVIDKDPLTSVIPIITDSGITIKMTLTKKWMFRKRWRIALLLLSTTTIVITGLFVSVERFSEWHGREGLVILLLLLGGNMALEYYIKICWDCE